ncbi:hypothetical protein [Thermanaeromonas toyohensis]|nr:hypothetical protein [Thermanaeromonas toyohensis]
MTKTAYERLRRAIKREVVTPNGSTGVGEYLDFAYRDGVLYVRGSNTTRDNLFDRVVGLLARCKDIDGIDKLDHMDLNDGIPGRFGRYYVDCGQWCYVAGKIPGPPRAGSRAWNEAKLPKMIFLVKWR